MMTNRTTRARGLEIRSKSAAILVMKSGTTPNATIKNTTNSSMARRLSRLSGRGVGA